MKPVHYLASLAALCVQAATAQVVAVWEGAAAPLNTSDQLTLARADQVRSGLEQSLRDYLVAFDGRMVNERIRVGVPLAQLANKQLNLAYDPAGKNIMAQWHLVDTRIQGGRLEYKAYVGASGNVSMLLSARF